MLRQPGDLRRCVFLLGPELGNHLLCVAIEDALPDDAHRVLHHRFSRCAGTKDFADDAYQPIGQRAWSYVAPPFRAVNSPGGSPMPQVPEPEAFSRRGKHNDDRALA
jgi:hypothetical protein